MRKTKKFTAILMCAVMVMAMLPCITVGAAMDWKFDVDTGTIVGYIGADVEELTIPSEINGVKIKTLGTGSGAFVGSVGFFSDSMKETVQRITLEEGITEIGASTFAGCTVLENIELPQSLNKIGTWAFSACRSMENIIIPNNVEEIDMLAFNSCTSLKSISLGDKVTSIPIGFAYNCTSLTDVSLAGTVTSIGDEAFNKCSSLKAIPSNISPNASIGANAFSKSGIENVTCLSGWTYPGSIYTIFDSPFDYCYELRSADIYSEAAPDFYACSSLEKIVCHEGVKHIGIRDEAKEVYLSSSVEKINYFGDKDTPNVIIYAPKNSEGYKFAMANGLEWLEWNDSGDSSTTLVVPITPDNSTEEFSDISKCDPMVQRAIKHLSEKGIFNGYNDGTFRPYNTVTRAEIAAILVRVLNYEPINTVYFSDVPLNHWAVGYVGAAYDNGIIDGMGDGTFVPDYPVTYEQAVKMVVSSFGYEPDAMKKGGYPMGYLSVAASHNFTDGVDGTIEKPITRAAVAQLIYNAID